MKFFIRLLAAIALSVSCLSVPCAAKDVGTLQEFTSNSLPAIVSSQQGQPFILVIWSLDCEFCQASLQNLAQAKSKHKKLRIVTLGTDNLFDDESAASMRSRLKQLKLHSQAWAFGGESAERLRFALDPKWHGEMPRSYWFDAQGNSKATSGVIAPQAIADFLNRQ